MVPPPARAGSRLGGWLAALVVLALGVVSARAHSNPPGCTGSGLGISLFADKLDAHVGETICYSALVFNTPFPACQAENVIAGIVTPDGITNRITLRRTTLNPSDSDFYTNVVCYVVRAQDVRADGTVRATAFDNGTIHQNDTDSQGGGFQGVNTEIAFPCILVTKQCVGGVGENGLITYSGTVVNCGNVPLSNVTVTNFVNGVFSRVIGPITLATNQTVSFQGSYVPLNPCGPVTDTLFAQGTDNLSFPSNVVSSASATCSNVLTPGLRVTKTCPAPVAPGQLLVYSGTVVNTGNVTLTNVVVVSDLPSPNSTVFTVATLAPGATANFSGNYIAPTNCASTSTLIARAASVCGVAVTDTVTSTCPVVTNPQIVVTALCPTSPVSPAGLLTFSGTVRNAGDITLSNVVVTTDRPAANTVVFTTATLAPGATANFTGSYNVGADVCSSTTRLTATGRDICTATAVSNATSITCPIITNPRVAVTLACPATPVATGATITYTGTVSNPGNVTLNNVVVANAGTGVFNIATLAPGASANFSFTSATPADSCSATTQVTASASDACVATVVTNTASVTCPLVTTPRIVVTQTCPTGVTALGGLLTYSGSVSNAGNVTLNNVLVVNDRTGNAAVFTVATLAPGAVANFTGSYTVPANNGCSITSTLTASGADKCTATAVSANATSTCSVAGSPQLAVTITCPPSAVALGGTLTFGGTVRNSGNITLTNVVVRRDAPASATPVFTIATLAPGASANFSGSYTVPVTDACSTVTTVTATANDQCAGAAIVANNSITCPIITAPRIVVTQACPPTPASPGGLLTYSGSVSNAGNVTLTNILVSNTQGTSPVFSLPSLAPGATANFTGSFVAPLNACSVTSTLEASGQDQCSASTVRNSVTSTCPLVTTPQIVVTKACPPQPVSAGGVLVFTGTVTNTGNITLNNVIVVNNQPSANTVVIGPITLAPGAGTNFTGSYTAPLNVCSVTDTLTATGRDQCGNTTVTNAVTATCPINTQPQVAITLVCPPTPVATGSLITYTGTVRNSGNVTLNNVTVVNDSAQPSTVLVVASLAPGASTNFTTSFTAPANACDLTTTVRVQGADSCNGLLASNTASATCPLITTPRIEITQNCPPTPATAGGLFNFSGTVRNTGNITLTNITVFSSRGAGSTNISPANGLVGYWTFNESSGTVANDSSGSGNHGTIVNAIRKNGVSGNALNFNSTSSTVDIANSPSLNFAGPITLVALVKPFSMSGIQDIVAHGYTTNAPAGGVFLRINNGRYEVGSWNGTDSPVASAPIPAGDINTYVTLVGVYNGSNWTLYRNGSIIASANSAFGAVQINARWAFGSRGGGGERFLNAELDEVRIYNRPLGTAEVATVGQPPTTTPPVTTPGVSTPVVTIATLAPGAMANYNGSFTVPVDAGCSITSTVTVTSSDICTGTQAGASDTITCPLATLPDIEVTHSCPTGPILQGSLLTYTGTVRNTGNSTLTNVVVTSDRPGANTVIFTTASLAPGASANFSGSYQVPTNCCVVSSTVAASGRDCNGTLVTDTDTSTCTVTTTPRLAVTKTCPTEAVAPGETLRYSGTVRNTGDIVLFNVTVSNNQPGNGSLLLGPITLAPGESATYEAAYVVPADFCGTDTVTARGLDACVFTPTTDSVTSSCPITLRPRIAITKDCPTVPTPPGGIFTFTGRVSNTGNVALTNVFVFNNMPSNNTPVIGPITLAPGESREFSGSYQARHCCCIIVDTLTATGRDRCGGTTVSATATAACQILSTPRIAVTQNCATTQVPVGGVFTFTGTVSNLGDGVLTNVFVFSNQGGANVSVLGPIELAVGEVKTFSGSYTVTATSNPTVNFLAASGTDACSTRTVTARANCAGPILQQVTAPVLNPIVSANGVVTLSWSATPGATYTLQSKAATETATWTDLPGNVTATGNTASKTDVMTPGQHRIYRVKVMPQQ